MPSEPTPRPEGPPPSRAFVVTACVLAAIPTALHAGSQTLFGGLSTDIRQALEASSPSMGLMAAAFGLPVLLLSPAAGMLVDRLGARRTLPPAIMGYGMCCAWFGLSASIANSTASRVAMGAFSAFLYPAFIAVSMRLVPADRRQQVVGRMQLALGATAILASLAATPILATDSWRAAFWTTAALMVALGAVLGRTLRSPYLTGHRGAGSPLPPLSVRQALEVPDIRRACAVAFVTGGLMIAFSGLLNVAVARIVWKLPESDWGLVNASFNLAYALGGVGLVHVTRRLGLARTIRAMLLVLAGSTAAWAYLPLAIGTPAACVVTFAVGLGTSAMSLATTVAVRAVPVASSGVAAALSIAAMSCGGMAFQAGTMASAAIPGTTPIERAHGCAAVVIAAVLLAYVTARRIEDFSPRRTPSGAARSGWD
ncbi:MAG: MFS transporter [Phycisphaerales bacterium]|nr:MFS transporter [Phycisphaerales bacterium]